MAKAYQLRSNPSVKYTVKQPTPAKNYNPNRLALNKKSLKKSKKA